MAVLDIDDIFTDTTMAYSPGSGKIVVGVGDVVESGGYRYSVTSANAADNHVVTAGGVKLDILPLSGWIDVEALGDTTTDMTATLNAILSAATATSPVRLHGASGSVVQIDGRLHVSPYSQIDFGDLSTGARFNLGQEGRVTQDGRSNIRAMIYAQTTTRFAPAFAFDSGFNAASPGMGHMETAFQIGVLGARQAGSVGVHLRAVAGYGVAWIKGSSADVRECDAGVRLEVDGNGYINENKFDFRVYAARQFYEDSVGAGELDSNWISITCQPDNMARAEQAVKTDGAKNRWSIKVWDWSGSNLNPAVRKHTVHLTNKSGFNEVTGYVDQRDFPQTSGILDQSNDLRRNRVQVIAQRVRYDPPSFYGPYWKQSRGEETNLLAQAVRDHGPDGSPADRSERYA